MFKGGRLKNKQQQKLKAFFFKISEDIYFFNILKEDFRFWFSNNLSVISD